MTDTLASAAAKLQLDEETGEYVSKNELKKRTQKRAKKLASEARAAQAKEAREAKDAQEAKPVTAAAKTAAEPIDPESIFKQGFLSDVYSLRPDTDVVTRFPPEPNGFLHIGHAKAILVNFGFAKYHGGRTILRFDDTNPDAEKEAYFTAIRDNIRWLGFKPNAITYTSDNFDRLYDLAETLIGLGRAYVCHCSKEETQKQRGGKDGKDGPRYRCVHAEQDASTNLAKFRDMRDGKYEPKEAFLRMKQDITNNNPQMWDLAAYRIPQDRTPHFRTGDKWKIYPTYDFAHCLCDSFEGITHSLCTTEFTLSRESYEWLNHTLGVYEPMQREYGRLNMTHTVMSKRKLKTLVESGHVRSWDDPRLFTINALRRRGIPPGAILAFIKELGVTTAKTTIQASRFEQAVRGYLETSAPRLMLVLEPLRVVLDDLGDLEGQALDVPFSPKDPSMGSRTLHLTSTVYIDRADFREADSPGYFRLAPGKTVGLLQVPYPIQATSFTKDSRGNVTEVRAVLVRDSMKRAKTYIQWVPDGEGAKTVEVRVHGPLFTAENPGSGSVDFLQEINPDSETIYAEARVEAVGLEEVRRRALTPPTTTSTDGGRDEEPLLGPECVRFQGMRVAYFAMDSDSTDDRVVLNRIVSLKEDSAK
ncbi:glutaminyl-tRNA synthetase [Sporothrix brasiliensis 5110]|uniref:glutamine--tRNA ligase n=1 Tax=Sporothrix brasiliensis 5110 TaxID=1398154 RepID=A0A0C2IXU2_9PEZI|nr:glutaminyl-tRNA synthetase [Sporothrix brasiliensis 5110]KIH89857.1 glutaminyl-tRNA synthetase [Sporothrix brasiliensis 5110]